MRDKGFPTRSSIRVRQVEYESYKLQKKNTGTRAAGLGIGAELAKQCGRASLDDFVDQLITREAELVKAHEEYHRPTGGRRPRLERSRVQLLVKLGGTDTAALVRWFDTFGCQRCTNVFKRVFCIFTVRIEFKNGLDTYLITF